MANRSAHFTLLGYLYQFDKTIIELLSLSKNGDQVTIEGIEDIDVATTAKTKAIQCKYFAAQTYYPSTLREPISAMLNHFAKSAGTSKFSYHLYLYFGDFRALPKNFTIAEVKEILTYTPKGKAPVRVHEDLGVTDQQLNTFIGCLSIERAVNFDDQHARVLDILRTQFNCEKLESEAFFYNNALRFVFDKATKRSIGDRLVSKKNFLNAINSKQWMLSRWLLELKGRDEFFKLIKKQLKQKKCLASQKSKGILLSSHLLSDPHYTFRRFCQDVIAAYYNKGYHLFDATPWTVVLDVSVSEVKKYKKELLDADVFFTDGYEHVSFAPSMFNRTPIKTKVVHRKTGKATEQLADSSYFLKVLTAGTYRSNRKHIHPLDVFFCETATDLTDYFSAPDDVDVIRLDSLTTLADLAVLLTDK